MSEWTHLVNIAELDWRHHGKEWIENFERMSGASQRRGIPLTQLDVAASLEGRTDARRLEFGLGAHKDPSALLRVMPLSPRGIKIDSVGLQQDAIERLRAAATGAAELLGTGNDRFAWEAVLGVGSEYDKFLESTNIGSIVILPGYRLARTEFGLPFVPIHIRGVIEGPSWFTAKPKARRQARLIAAILTLAWQERFVGIRRPVWSSSANDDWLEIEEVQPFPGARSFTAMPEIVNLSVPSSISDSWQRVQADQYLADALLAYHEGMKLFGDNHPSFAFAAFSTVLESIGAITVPLSEPCECCRQSTGAMKRFRAGIAEAPLGDDLASRLKKAYSTYRSPTVHGGQLHGGEEGGLSREDLANPFVFSEDDRFLVELGVLKNHCRKVLQAVLTRGR